MADHRLPFLQKPLGHGYALVKQAAGIAAEIQQQTFDVLFAEHPEAFIQFAAGRLGELGDLYVGYPGAYEESVLHAVALYLVPRNFEFKRLLAARPRHGDLYGCAARAFEQVGYIGRRKAFGRFAADRKQDVAWPQPRPVGRSAREDFHHHGPVVARAHAHADPVVMASLLLAHELKVARVKKAGVRIQGAQHARNGAVVNGLIRIRTLGGILLHLRIHAAEQA